MKPTKDSSNEIQLKWWRSRGIVYFVAAGTPPIAIKIGVATRDAVIKRVQTIQTHNHETIELLGVIPFDSGEFPMCEAEDRERLLHIQFAHLQRFKPHTRAAEWFTFSPELLACIVEISIPPEQFGFPRFVGLPFNRESVDSKI